MTTLFSKSCEYALQAMLYLARQEKDQPVLLKDISDGLNIPYHFLSKVLQTLARNNMVISYKGANGGFLLSQSPHDTVLIDIVRTVDGVKFLEDCILGFPGCGDRSPCPVHNRWRRAKKIILNVLNQKTLAELSKELDPKLRLIERLVG